MENGRSELVQDFVGAIWVVAVVVTFLGLPYGLAEASVSLLEKVYALCLIAGVVWLAYRATGNTAKGAKGRD